MRAVFAAPAFIGAAFAAAVARDTNGPCSSNGNSTAPAPGLNTLIGFETDGGYTTLATSAQVPAGYQLTLANGNCTLSSTKYMLYTKLSSYDVQACADTCDAHTGCNAFNIYVQRDPSVVPGLACPNPRAIFVSICALYSEPAPASSCTNLGQYIGPENAMGDAFKVAIRASNEYARVSANGGVSVVTVTRSVFVDKPSPSIPALSPPAVPSVSQVNKVTSDISNLKATLTTIPPGEIPWITTSLPGVLMTKPTGLPSAPSLPLTTPAVGIPSSNRVESVLAEASKLQSTLSTMTSALPGTSIKMTSIAISKPTELPSMPLGVPPSAIPSLPAVPSPGIPSPPAISTPGVSPPAISRSGVSPLAIPSAPTVPSLPGVSPPAMPSLPAMSSLPAIPTSGALLPTISRPAVSPPVLPSPSVSLPAIPIPSAPLSAIPSPGASLPAIPTPGVSPPAIPSLPTPPAIPTSGAPLPAISRPAVSPLAISSPPAIPTPAIPAPGVSSPAIPSLPGVFPPGVSPNALSNTISLPGISPPGVSPTAVNLATPPAVPVNTSIKLPNLPSVPATAFTTVVVGTPSVVQINTTITKTVAAPSVPALTLTAGTLPTPPLLPIRPIPA